MTEKNWTTWEEGYSFTQENGRNLDDPFPNQRITENTIFVWSEMTTPMPCSSTGGTWAHFPDAGAACGFLRHLLLPQFFEIWLVREEWDADPESHIMAEDLFDRAIAAGECRYADDIPEMREVITLLDQAIASDSSEACFQFLEKSAQQFNHFWSNTGTWCFEIEVYPDPVPAGKRMGKRWLGFFDETPSEWAVPVARQRQTSRPAQNSRRI
jgi:hypothetical protein